MAKRFLNSDQLDDMFVFSKQELQDIINKSVQEEIKKLRKENEIQLGPKIEFIGFDNLTNTNDTYQDKPKELEPEIVLSSDDDSNEDVKFNISTEKHFFGDLIHGESLVNSVEKELCPPSDPSQPEPTLQTVLDHIVKLQTTVDNLNAKVTNLEYMILSDSRRPMTKQERILDSLNPHFPLKTVEEFNKIETQLKDKVFYDKMLTFCSKVGGDNGRRQTKRLFQRIFKDELAMKFSWKGQQNNIPLKDKLLIRVMRESVICSHSDFTEYNFKAETANWFRFAKVRILRKRN